MAIRQDFSTDLAGIDRDSVQELERFLGQSDVRMGSGRLAEQRLLESLALAYSFQLTAN